MARPEVQAEEVRDDRLILLDEALTRLPAKYRLVLVLCELEGRTRREAAERLGWPEGTVAGRLARGRDLLAKRLIRKGLTLSVGSMAAELSAEATQASVPPPLASSTIKAALGIAAGHAATAGAISASVAALAEGVLKSMFLSKLKLATAVVLTLVLLGLGGTAGVLAWLAGEEPPAAQQPDAPKRDKEKSKAIPREKQVQAEMEKKPPASVKVDDEYRIRPGDLLDIQIANAVPKDIRAIFQVESSGKVALGLGYGRVNVKGLTLEEAEKTIQEHLAKILRDSAVLVTRPIPDNPALENRVRQLENEVRELRSLVDELRRKDGSEKR